MDVRSAADGDAGRVDRERVLRPHDRGFRGVHRQDQCRAKERERAKSFSHMNESLVDVVRVRHPSKGNGDASR